MPKTSKKGCVIPEIKGTKIKESIANTVQYIATAKTLLSPAITKGIVAIFAKNPAPEAMAVTPAPNAAKILLMVKFAN